MPLETISLDVAAALGGVLETMAFMSPLPPEPDQPAPACPPDAVLAAIGFTGPHGGTLELVAGMQLAMTLAANLLGTDPADPEAEARCRDALKEVMNVTCGTVVQQLPDFPQVAHEMGIPVLVAFDPRQWDAFTAAAGAAALDIDGHTVAIRLRA
ncbi:MAG TPA: chemotaxis protein CheX [Tepidisphaeraceae bacterium]|nr:chemotaxis protein CheX [Tepidisphaeraceae bacterium]